MKITAGIGSIDSYEKIVESGVDEVFCGYVPFSWNEKYGNVLPLNRREVLFYHVQIGTLEDMKILKQMVKKYGILVAITFNALYYTREQIDDLTEIIKQLIEIGFKDFIIADVNLVRHLSKQKIPCNIHFSGEIGEWNTRTIRLLFKDFSNDITTITRIIFHRKCSFEDMKKCIAEGRKWKVDLEFEAFCMNEKCHYTGGYCNSLHCDEMLHLCQLEYQLASISEEIEKIDVAEHNMVEEQEKYLPGESGCGLCAIRKFREIGITHLKVVGRGNSIDCVVTDVLYVRKAINMRSHKEIQQQLFRGRCSENCYYYDFE